jgi:hypothetical protein
MNLKPDRFGIINARVILACDCNHAIKVHRACGRETCLPHKRWGGEYHAPIPVAFSLRIGISGNNLIVNFLKY